mgnify:CR=1
MRIFNKYRGTRGFVVAAERGIHFRYMITKEAKLDYSQIRATSTGE